MRQGWRLKIVKEGLGSFVTSFVQQNASVASERTNDLSEPQDNAPLESTKLPQSLDDPATPQNQAVSLSHWKSTIMGE